MRYTSVLLFLLSFNFCKAGVRDTTYIQPLGNWYNAAQAIKELKHGALVVRLKTNDRSIDAYRRAGKKELADKIVAEGEALNKKIAEAFSSELTFCKVYFIYAKNTAAMLKREPNIYLNTNLQVDSSIKLTQPFVLIAEYGASTWNQPADEYHYSGIHNTEVSASLSGSSSLIVLDTTLTQLQEPFPFQQAVYLGLFRQAVQELDRRFNKSYDHLMYKEEMMREKLQKFEVPKK